MKRKSLCALISYFLLVALVFIGCSEKAYKELSTPEKTLDTYTHYAPLLLRMISLQDYLKAISCFSKEDRDWFENNYDSLPRPQDDPSYKILNIGNKKAYMFGEIVSKSGPRNAKITNKEESGSDVILYVQNYSQPIRLTKEGPNWRIVGLFGVEN